MDELTGMKPDPYIWPSIAPDSEMINYKDCDDKKAWHDGDCCCNCRYFAVIEGHPWNKNTAYTKKGTGEILGFGCTNFFVLHQIEAGEGTQEPGTRGIVTFFESGHGMCEMHIRIMPKGE